MNLHALYDLCFRYQRGFLIALTLGLLVAALDFYRAPPRYRSEAKLLVRYMTDAPTIDPEITGKRMEEPDNQGETMIKTEEDILTSAGLIATAAAAQAAQNGTPPPGAGPVRGRENFSKYYKVLTSKDSNTILVFYDGTTPTLARQALQCLVAAYLERHQEVHQDPGAFAFIAQQTGEMQKQLNDTEEELRRLKQELGVTSLNEARESVQTRERDLTREMSLTESALAAAVARQQALLEATTRAPPAGAAGSRTNRAAAPVEANPHAADWIVQLHQLRLAEAGLLATYKPDSIPVRSIRTRIDAMQAQLGPIPSGRVLSDPAAVAATQERYAADPLTAQYLLTQRAEASALTAELTVLRDQVQSARADARHLEQAEAPIARLERTREIHEANYRYFSQRLEMERINAAMDASKISNIVLIQSPTLPLRPLYTDGLKRLLMILAAFLGPSLALALAREHLLDHALRRPDDVPRLLSIPLLTTLPVLPEPPRRARALPFAEAPKRPRDGQLHWAAGCEVLAQMVRQWAREVEGPLMIGFTTPDGGAGVSTVAGRVAQALQQTGAQKVMLATVLDTGHLVLQSPGEESQDILAGQAQTVAADSPPPVGDVSPPSEAMESLRAVIGPDAISQLTRQEYDCVLVDLPPPELASASVRLLPNLHGVVVVIDHAHTTRARALACLDLLGRLRCRILGGVLNRYASPIPAWLEPAAFAPARAEAPAADPAEEPRAETSSVEPRPGLLAIRRA